MRRSGRRQSDKGSHNVLPNHRAVPSTLLFILIQAQAFKAFISIQCTAVHERCIQPLRFS